MPKNLLRDIDLETLYAMRRDEQMTNEDIADRVGVSYATVLRLIGHQPKELRKKSGGYTRKAERVEEEPIPACLVVENKNITLVGTFGKYEVDYRKGRVSITDAIGQVLCVNKDMLGELINELSAIKRKMEVLSFENEAW